MARAAWQDFRLTNSSAGGKAAKLGAGMIVGSALAREFGALTPLQWASRGFGAIPAEFTSSGTLQVFRWSFGQRLLHVVAAAGMKFVLVTVAFEGGVAVGSVFNQTLSERSKDAIGGALNEIVHCEGWKELWRHPFGLGL
ncbi:MAG: hypothetical protein IPL40_09940 [Proteobacteria bacterium]|nr:hypothetical protein [Pseudomonadota bacterium]